MTNITVAGATREILEGRALLAVAVDFDDALGDAFGDALGDTFGDALGDALGAAVAGGFGVLTT